MRLFTVSFLALFLELLMIRWTPAQVRLIAYYANLMLISSFLGLGLRAMLAGRKWGLSKFFLPAMLALTLLILHVRAIPLSGVNPKPGSSAGPAPAWGFSCSSRSSC